MTADPPWLKKQRHITSSQTIPLSALRFRHYGFEAIRALYNVPQQRTFFKPAGLWLSVENSNYSWKDLCEDASLPLGSFVYDVILSPTANILLLNDATTIRNFTKTHITDNEELRQYAFIDWNSVARLYQGLVIAPYCPAGINETDILWHDTWQCASACIWDHMAIHSVSLTSTCLAHKDAA